MNTKNPYTSQRLSVWQIEWQAGRVETVSKQGGKVFRGRGGETWPEGWDIPGLISAVCVEKDWEPTFLPENIESISYLP